MDITNVRQVLQFGPIEKKIETLGEINREGHNLPLADLQDSLDAFAFAGGKHHARFYALRALIVMGDRRDSTIDGLTEFFGEDFFKDSDDNIIRFPWVPEDLPAPEEAISILTFRLKGNISYAVVEALSRAKQSEKAAAFFGKVLNVIAAGDARVMCIYGIGALGHPSNRAALEYYANSMSNTPEGRAAQISLEYFGQAPVFGLIRQHASKYGKPATPKAGCFIVTAVCGDENSFEVLIFRVFRDVVLARSTVGRMLVHAYYRMGPELAAQLGKHPRFCKFMRNAVVIPLANLFVLARIPERATRVNFLGRELPTNRFRERKSIQNWFGSNANI